MYLFFRNKYHTLLSWALPAFSIVWGFFYLFIKIPLGVSPEFLLPSISIILGLLLYAAMKSKMRRLALMLHIVFWAYLATYFTVFYFAPYVFPFASVFAAMSMTLYTYEDVRF